MSRPVVVRFIGDPKHLNRTVTQVEGRVGAFSGRVRGLIGPAIASAAVIGAAAVVKLGADAVAAGRESIAIAKQTDAVIRSTGGAANVTAKHASNLAGALSKVAAVDDDVIQGGENILLTFTNIKNTKTDKVFDKTSAAALDMAAALNHGEVNADNLQAANLQLGKALNDPLKGITRLQRVGVTFSAQQKEQIANFVKHGQTAKAQGVILAEVTKEFGGSAKASATSWKHLTVTLGNMSESIGKFLIPILDKMATFIVEVIIPGLTKFGHVTGAVITAVVGWFRRFDKQTGDTRNTFSTVRNAIRTIMESIRSIIRTVLSWIAAFWKVHGDTIVKYARASFQNILQIIRGVFQIIQGVFKLFSSLLKGDWRGMWEAIKTILRGAANIVVGVVRQLWNAIKTNFLLGLNTIKGWAKSRLADIVSFFRGLPGRIVGAMAGLGASLVSHFSGAIKKVLNFLGIHSPSRVFERIGHALIDGLARGIAHKMKEIPDLLGKLQAMAFGAVKEIGPGLFPTLGAGGLKGGSGGPIVALARNMAAAMGWTGAQWQALYNLVMGESGWRPTAQNPTSSAYGLFQFLDSTWASVGFRKTSDVQTQIAAGLAYIKRVYGSPLAAYSAWLSRSPHWYAQGGIIPEPVFGIGSRSGESYVFGEAGPERVSPLRDKGRSVIVNVQSNANPWDIGREVDWVMRTSGY